ncbi:Protein kinase domain containing protein [Entamoeba marina]
MLKKDPASPFPKLMLSPLAFVLGKINEVNKNPLPQIACMIEKLKLKENDVIINGLKNQLLIEEIMEMQTVKDLKYFVNGPIHSKDEYFNKIKFGEGSNGIVSTATDLNRKVVVIKDDKHKYCDNLKRESIIMRLCDHKNIVKFVCLTTNEPINQNSCDLSLLNNVSLVMEYCNGGNLEAFVYRYTHNKGSTLSPDLIANFFSQITSAQHYMHFQKRLFHRDIKPNNFLLIKNELYPIIKCCDFGFSRSIDTSQMTKAGAHLFAAPEIILEKPYSDKSDLYSLGICLYFLTTSTLPFETMEERKQQKTPILLPLKYQTGEYEHIFDLVKQLTVVKEEERMSWDKFYEHEYMKQIKLC